MSGTLAQLKGLYAQCFPEDSEALIALLFSDKLDEKNVLYEQENGRIVAALYLVEKQLVFHGRLLPLPFIVALGTAPQYRGRGFAARLLRRAFSTVKAPFIGLYPVYPKLYEKFGFTTVYTPPRVPEALLRPCAFTARQLQKMYDLGHTGADFYQYLTEADFEYRLKELAADGIMPQAIHDGEREIGFCLDGAVCLTQPLSAPLCTEGFMLRTINPAQALSLSGISLSYPLQITDRHLPTANVLLPAAKETTAATPPLSVSASPSASQGYGALPSRQIEGQPFSIDTATLTALLFGAPTPTVPPLIRGDFPASFGSLLEFF